MKKPFLLFILAASVLSLSGCWINMTAMTKINDDGSGFRITTYTADGASEKEEVLKNYTLPPGGEWRLNRYVKDAPPVHIYEAKRTFTDIKRLAADYARKGAKDKNRSYNDFSLKIRKSILFTTYEYEEVFKDCADKEKIDKFCKNWYGRCLDFAAADIEEAFPKIVRKKDVRALLDAKYRPYLDYFLPAFLVSGRKIFDERNTQSRIKMAEFEDEYSAENFSSFMADYIMSLDKSADRKAVMVKLKEVHAKIDSQYSDYNSLLRDINFEDVFGAYGWPVFMGYSFNVSVVMPGRITEANTAAISLNAAKWEFTNDDFFLDEFRIHAKSRKLNFAGIGVIAAMLMAALFIRYKMERKNK